MSEVRNSSSGRSEITVRNLRTHKVGVLRGRFGTFADAYEHARKSGFELLTYTAIE